MPFKRLFCDANDSVSELMISIKSGVSLRYRPCYKNMLNYDNDSKCLKLATLYKSRFSLILELILAFGSSTDLIREVKNLSPIFKRIA